MGNMIFDLTKLTDEQMAQDVLKVYAMICFNRNIKLDVAQDVADKAISDLYLELIASLPVAKRK